MNPSQIVVRNLSKTYRVPEREQGLGAALKSLVQRRYRDVAAVREISFNVETGEMVGFIGPNGAGKTTTLKMLSWLASLGAHLGRPGRRDDDHPGPSTDRHACTRNATR